MEVGWRALSCKRAAAEARAARRALYSVMLNSVLTAAWRLDEEPYHVSVPRLRQGPRAGYCTLSYYTPSLLLYGGRMESWPYHIHRARAGQPRPTSASHAGIAASAMARRPRARSVGAGRRRADPTFGGTGFRWSAQRLAKQKCVQPVEQTGAHNGWRVEQNRNSLVYRFLLSKV